MKNKIAPSILSADFGNFARDVKRLESAGADLVHIDVMDGHFVDNLTFGAGVVSALRAQTHLFFDVHMMVENPEKYGKIDILLLATPTQFLRTILKRLKYF